MTLNKIDSERAVWHNNGHETLTQQAQPPKTAHPTRKGDLTEISSITVFDPFREMRSLMRCMSDDAFFAPTPIAPNGGGRRSAWRLRDGELAPPIDAYKTDGALKVETPLPGFAADEIQVSLENGVLTIRAEHAQETTKDTGEDETSDHACTYVVLEGYGGAAKRSILIGDDYDADSVDATLKDGVLTLTIQTLPEVQPKRIAVTAG